MTSKYIVDCDGFYMSKNSLYDHGEEVDFILRELSIVPISSKRPSLFLNVQPRFSFVEIKQQLTRESFNKFVKNVKYNINNIHGIPFDIDYSKKSSYVKFDEVNSIVNNYLPKNYSLWAKGSSLEEKILNIPINDLSYFGCPKYEDIEIIKTLYYKTQLQLNNHYHINNNIHCPLKETLAFAQWCKNSIKNMNYNVIIKAG